jgi:hypothetical protein
MTTWHWDNHCISRSRISASVKFFSTIEKRRILNMEEKILDGF